MATTPDSSSKRASRISIPKDESSSTNNDQDNDPTVPSPPFHDLVMLLEEISRKRTEKSPLLRRYFQEWRENGYGDMFPVIRLILPQLDRERGRYGLKEQKMADLYIISLNILPGSEPAIKLKNWKEGSRDSSGDFSLIVREVVASRSLVTHPQGQTIRDVNRLLTGLSRKGSDNIHIFKTLVQSYTPLENKWIVRIINRDLKIHMNENSVLPCYHQDAFELFNVCSDLRKTVLDCADPTVRISTSTVSLGRPYKPMLSKRLPSAKDVVESMGNMTFWIETKLDGERVQVHKDGDKYRYWSRNSTEYTHLYGATSEEGSLTPFLHPLINPKVESLILDGEMVEYDPATKQILGFGTVKTAGGDHSGDKHKRRPLLFVFDVLYMNGASIIDQPLEARRDMLPSIFIKEREGHLEILKYQVASTEQHIIDAIDAAVMDRQEGVIVKNPRSVYLPNGRGKDWVKIKPEYIDGICDSLDVLIVGGYYGTGSRGGQGVISSYLCAVRDNTSKSSTGKKFLTFCKFGSGFSYQQMGKFSDLLSPHWKEYKYYKENPWVEMFDSAKMRPDVIIDPAKSIVVEVKASEILPNTDSYAAEYTLRFPRFLHIRQDKDMDSCMTMSEVHRMFREFKGKLSNKQFSARSSTALIKVKEKLAGPRKSTQARLLHSIVGDMSAFKIETDLFKGQVFWVVRGDQQHSKSELEVLIKRFGGKQSQSDQVEGTIIIAGVHGPDLIGLKKKGHRNIVLPTWIRACINELRLIPLNPKYMLFTTKETEKQFRLIMDEYKDSYTEPLTAEGLQEILDKMPNRSEVVKRRRLKAAEETAARNKMKRLNNFADQIESSAVNKDIDDKEVVLQMEIDNLDKNWEQEDARRARKIAAELTRRYYGKEGEREPPLGMFQGLEVFVVYPPSPTQLLQSIASQPSTTVPKYATNKVKREPDDTNPGSPFTRPKIWNTKCPKGPTREFESTFDVLSDTIDFWSMRRDESASQIMADLDAKSSQRMKEIESLGMGSPFWEYVDKEKAYEEELDQMLDKICRYQLCRENLDMISQILEFHGAVIMPPDQCNIEHCQQLLRDRVSANYDFKLDERYVGIPNEIIVLFDPCYLEPLDEWQKAMRISTLYGSDASSFDVPRLVTTEWVKQSQKSEYRVPEEAYYPIK
ncbi:ATP dependent DNA ligase domain-domain-containing protein [Lobosporangium transversale]|uniref:DNA ligase n=1 Tax=Lobosporangium transversale TaxID=64571 RepID=A0A1Y2GRY7_9FUNG|nr:ATP dependent DNA ligase domain-domain-containing protein [Lobosporangium transversale]ORZ16003.1 ATP dependent DNA ligase domain-domain-containing protein [Lobosporangium transversale]|eukprot:XP_021881350.1 ATP dependent DNA ligase domain-domain-containing protein [Lobosporangium transversale]